MPYALALALLLLTLVFVKRRVSSGFVDAVLAHQLVADGAPLIDVRSPAEFASGHIDGARNIPLAQLRMRSNEVGAKDSPVVVYCRSGMRSAKAKSVLEAAGFTRVHNLGGQDRW